MAKILSVYTPGQGLDLMRDKVIADNVGLTNFEQGSRIRALFEAVSLIASTTGLDFMDAVRLTIPIALYEGLNFTKIAKTSSIGALRYFRLPIFYINYTGSDSSVELDISATQLTLTTSGTPGDDITLAFSTYPKSDDLVSQINAHANYNAYAVNNQNVDSNTLYQYSSSEIKGTYNYLNQVDTRDVVIAGLPAVFIGASSLASIDSIVFQTTTTGNITSGDATSGQIDAQALEAGTSGNIIAGAIDTLNGKGNMSSPINGADYVKNDAAFSGGDDEEADEARATRFSTTIQGLNAGTRRGIEAAILEIPGIKSVSVRPNDPQYGTITIVADDGTGNLSAALQAEILKVVDGDPNDIVNYPGKRAAGVTANIVPPVVVPVPITVLVQRIGTVSDETEIKTFVKSAIENYVNTRRLGDDVVISKIIEEGRKAHPAVYDIPSTAITPSSNVPIGTDEIARTAGTTGVVVTVNVQTLATIP
jgi:hypothetical protein